MSSTTNKQILQALKDALPELFTEENKLDLQKFKTVFESDIHATESSTKKYGLVWEDKPEQFETDSIGKLPVITKDETKSFTLDANKPTHVLIQGDNYHALKVLNYTHERGVDVIYIDPPYNTGVKEKGRTDFKYNDTYVDKDDAFKHSKWLSFMSKRIQLSKSLLKDDGVLFLSINEYEFAQVKLLCDSIFGEQNNIIHWKTRSPGGQVKSGALVRQIEYILIYFKNSDKSSLSALDFSDGEEDWRDFRKSGGKWQRQYRPNQFYPLYVDPNSLEIKLNPFPQSVTILPLDSKGIEGFWGNSSETAADKINNGRLKAIKSKDGAIKIKVNNSEAGKALNMGNLFDLPSSKGGEVLKSLNLVFENPKPVELVSTIVKISGCESNGVILDFFAGSGTTGHAVAQLNKEDGGTRTCILVTNDEGEFKGPEGTILEGGICTHVTYPRMQKVLKGYTNSKGEVVAPLGENLAFFKTEFVADAKTHAAKLDLTKRSIDMLCLAESCLIKESTKTSAKNIVWASYGQGDTATGKRLLVLFDECSVDQIKTEIEKDSRPTVLYAFVHYDDEDTLQNEIGDFEHLTIKPIPVSLLNLYRRLNKEDTK